MVNLVRFNLKKIGMNSVYLLNSYRQIALFVDNYVTCIKVQIMD